MDSLPWKKCLIRVLLVTMMVPWTVGIITWFFMMPKFEWINNYLALIIPGCENTFGIF
ncbi:hypothetical protein [Clostridium sp.]|uniref:hypothetical protein n=1 Tax=Clostridium sp. TaxID=1506 RepID=UPI00260F2D07|nr:hypothetical protein [uncultured Clostridium sp.]